MLPIAMQAEGPRKRKLVSTYVFSHEGRKLPAPRTALETKRELDNEPLLLRAENVKNKLC